MEIYTNSSLRIFRECPYKYYLEYEKMVDIPRPPAQITAMESGTVIHNAVIHKHLTGKNSLNREEFPDLWVLMEYYQPDNIEIIEPELQLSYYNDRMGYCLAGILDGIIRKDNQVLIMETKTSRTRKAEKGWEEYWVRWELDNQINMYSILARLNNINNSGILINFIRRPSLRGRTSESRQDFYDRLSLDIKENIQTYFVRVNINRTEEQDRLGLSEIEQAIRMIKSCRDNNIFPRSGERCDMYGDLCIYQIICRGEHSQDEYDIRDIQHPELNYDKLPKERPVF